MPGKPLEDITKELQKDFIAKLSSNENLIGPSPSVFKAMMDEFSKINMYPHPQSPNLLDVLSKKLNRPTTEIMCACGVDALILYAVMAFCEKDENIVCPYPTFIGLMVNAKKLDRKVKCVDLTHHTIDLKKVLENIDPNTKIIYLANPNNPTGTYFNNHDFKLFMQQVPKHILVILDEAYFEYASNLKDYPNGNSFQYENLLVFRTFSKAFGLAGLRIGYGFGPDDLIQSLYKVKMTFEPSRLAQAAAMAALNDQKHLDHVLEENKNGLLLFEQGLKALGLRFIEKSASNFITILFDSSEQAINIKNKVYQDGLVVRPLQAFGMDHAIRMNTGSKQHNDMAINIIKKVIQGGT